MEIGVLIFLVLFVALVVFTEKTTIGHRLVSFIAKRFFDIDLNETEER